jgi:HEAT repeat protein
LKIQERFAHDRFTSVRREALEQRAKRFPEQGDQLWKNALYDSSRSIRELARFMLRDYGIDQTAVAAMYRVALAEKPDSLLALEGLTEVGDVTDAPIFRSYLQHRFPTRRAAAIRALARVHKDMVIPDILPYLSDECPCVVRAVRNAIGGDVYSVDGSELERIARQSPGFYSRKNAIELLFVLGKWNGIPHLLAVASSAEPATAKYAEHTLLRWYKPLESVRVFISPTEQNRLDTESKLTNAAGKVSENILSLIRRDLERFAS